VVHCEGKCQSCSFEGDDRLSKTNDTKLEFIAKEEEECDWYILPIQYELILIIIRSKGFDGNGWRI
jgi:hypothetical protein